MSNTQGIRLKDLAIGDKEAESKEPMLATRVPSALNDRIDEVVKHYGSGVKKRDVIIALLNEGLTEFDKQKKERKAS